MNSIDRGMVVTTEHLLAPDGHWVRAFAGHVQVLDAAATLGITPGDRDSTWYARVERREPPENGPVVYIPGCKVSAIIDLASERYPQGDVWR